MHDNDLMPLINKELGYGTAVGVTPGVGSGRGMFVFDPTDGADGPTTSDRIILGCPDHLIDKLVLLDITDPEVSYGANPIAMPEDVPDEFRTMMADNVLRLLDRHFGLTGRSRPMTEYMRALIHAMSYVPGATICDISAFIDHPESIEMALSLVPDGTDMAGMRRAISGIGDDESRSMSNKMYRFLSTDSLRHVFGQSLLTINLRRMLDAGMTIMLRIPSARSRMETAFCREMMMSGDYDLMFPDVVWGISLIPDRHPGEGGGAAGTGDDDMGKLATRKSHMAKMALDAGYIRHVDTIDEELLRRTEMICRCDADGLRDLYATTIADWATN